MNATWGERAAEAREGEQQRQLDYIARRLAQRDIDAADASLLTARRKRILEKMPMQPVSGVEASQYRGPLDTTTERL